MFFSIGSMMSHSWKAAVSFVIVCPSKMCDVLSQCKHRDPKVISTCQSSLSFCLLRTLMFVYRAAFMATGRDGRPRHWVVGVTKVQSLVAEKGSSVYCF